MLVLQVPKSPSITVKVVKGFSHSSSIGDREEVMTAIYSVPCLSEFSVLGNYTVYFTGMWLVGWWGLLLLPTV